MSTAFGMLRRICLLLISGTLMVQGFHVPWIIHSRQYKKKIFFYPSSLPTRPMVIASTTQQDVVSNWTLGGTIDDDLLAEARREAMANDEEWYTSIIESEARAKEEGEEESSDLVVAGMDEGTTLVKDVVDEYTVKLTELGFSLEEASKLPRDVGEIIIENGITRPSGTLPWEWLFEDDGTEGSQKKQVEGGDGESNYLDDDDEEEEEEEERRSSTRIARRRRLPLREDVAAPLRSTRRKKRPSTTRMSSKERKRRFEDFSSSSAYDDDEEENLKGPDEQQRAYESGLRTPLYNFKYEEEDEYYGPAFTEQEPGLLPILVENFAERIRKTPLLRPLLREDRFKSLLSQEADLRLMVTGSWAADMLRDEYRWRLGLFRDYLKVEKGRQMPFDDDDDDDESVMDEYYERPRPWESKQRGRASLQKQQKMKKKKKNNNNKKKMWAWDNAEQRDWDDDDDDKLDDVWDTDWIPDDAEEEEEEAKRRRARPSRRRRREVDRRFMGLEAEESTNDRSAAWTWLNAAPAASPQRRRHGSSEEEEETAEEDFPTAPEIMMEEEEEKEEKEGQEKKQKEQQQTTKTKKKGFRWPWSSSAPED